MHIELVFLKSKRHTDPQETIFVNVENDTCVRHLKKNLQYNGKYNNKI